MARRSNPARRVRPRLTASADGAPGCRLGHDGRTPRSRTTPTLRRCEAGFAIAGVAGRQIDAGHGGAPATCARGARQPRRETSPPPGPMATRAVASCASPAPHAFRFVSFPRIGGDPTGAEGNGPWQPAVASLSIAGAHGGEVDVDPLIDACGVEALRLRVARSLHHAEKIIWRTGTQVSALGFVVFTALGMDDGGCSESAP